MTDQEKVQIIERSGGYDMIGHHTIGPYCAISRDTKIHFALNNGSRSFRVAIYGAYNALGLIGSEGNGIAVFDEDNLFVVLDEHAKEQTGYFGPSQAQLDEFQRIINLTWDEFCALVRNHRRARPSVTGDGCFIY